ncbi:MAG: hypothetical protein ACK5R2_16615, partial [Cyanobacteriota bacterium]
MDPFSCRRPQVVAGDNLGAIKIPTGQLGCRESAKGVDAGQTALNRNPWTPGESAEWPQDWRLVSS